MSDSNISNAVSLNRVDTSDFICDTAADIETCRRSLLMLAENIDDKVNEHCLLLLVIDKLEVLNHKLNEFDVSALRDQP